MTVGSARHILHLVSDSTGETASAAANAVLSQYDGLEITRRLHVFVRTEADLDAALGRMAREPGLVVYTLLDHALGLKLREGCVHLGLEAVAPLDPLFAAVSAMTGAPRVSRPGRQHVTGAGYFERVAAIDYAMTHDDGATPERLRRAHVILVGVSRTSKTPTCLYLAVRGIKAANVPLVPGRALPEALVAAVEAGIPAVGLTVSPSRLVQIRGQRLETIGGPSDGGYADPERVREEVAQARIAFDRLGLPVIDVTRRSIEETAASVMALLRARQESGAEAAPGRGA